MSAAVVNGNMEPEPDRGNVPVYSYSLSGVVLAPGYNVMRCSFAFDVGSIMRQCYGGEAPGCLPGCTAPEWRQSHRPIFCDPSVSADELWPCAFHPSNLDAMMRVQATLRTRNTKPRWKVWDDHKFYNEVIFDDVAFESNLPHSIEAVFFLEGTDCNDVYDGPKCEAYARGAHRNMLRHFGLTQEQLPLLAFDFRNWATPFRAVENCAGPAEPGSIYSCVA